MTKSLEEQLLHNCDIIVVLIGITIFLAAYPINNMYDIPENPGSPGMLYIIIGIVVIGIGGILALSLRVFFR